ncbi:alpha/beta hydrolase [Lipomyces starkeyi]
MAAVNLLAEGVKGEFKEKSSQESEEAKTLKAAKKYMAIRDDDALNMFELPDQNWLQVLGRLDVDWDSIPHGNDLYAIRDWVQRCYLPISKTIHAKRVRPEVPVVVEDQRIVYDTDKSFLIRIYSPNRPSAAEVLRPALLMYHGGGFIHGNPSCDDDLSRFFASDLDVVVISVDYSLAPENKFPRPLDDCYEALNWVAGHAKEKGINSSKIGVWGCSAGANLAAAVALKDSHLHSPSRILQMSLVVPVTCAPEAYSGAIKTVFERRSALEPNQLVFARNISAIFAFYAEGQEFFNPLVSPLLSAVSPSHPPTHITVAGRDSLREEGIAYACKLRNSDVDVQLDVLPGVPHGFTWATKSTCMSQFVRNQVRLFNVAFYTDF